MCHFTFTKISFFKEILYHNSLCYKISVQPYLTSPKCLILLSKCLCMMGLYASLSAGASFFCCLSSHGIGLKVVCVAGQARWEFVACPLVTDVVTLGSDYMQNKPLNRKLVLMQIWLIWLRKRENWTNNSFLFVIKQTIILFVCFYSCVSCMLTLHDYRQQAINVENK